MQPMMSPQDIQALMAKYAALGIPIDPSMLADLEAQGGGGNVSFDQPDIAPSPKPGMGFGASASPSSLFGGSDYTPDIKAALAATKNAFTQGIPVGQGVVGGVGTPQMGPPPPPAAPTPPSPGSDNPWFSSLAAMISGGSPPGGPPPAGAADESPTGQGNDGTIGPPDLRQLLAAEAADAAAGKSAPKSVLESARPKAPLQKVTADPATQGQEFRPNVMSQQPSVPEQDLIAAEGPADTGPTTSDTGNQAEPSFLDKLKKGMAGFSFDTPAGQGLLAGSLGILGARGTYGNTAQALGQGGLVGLQNYQTQKEDLRKEGLAESKIKQDATNEDKKTATQIAIAKFNADGKVPDQFSKWFSGIQKQAESDPAGAQKNWKIGMEAHPGWALYGGDFDASGFGKKLNLSQMTAEELNRPGNEQLKAEYLKHRTEGREQPQYEQALKKLAEAHGDRSQLDPGTLAILDTRAKEDPLVAAAIHSTSSSPLGQVAKPEQFGTMARDKYNSLKANFRDAPATGQSAPHVAPEQIPLAQRAQRKAKEMADMGATKAEIAAALAQMH